MPQKYKISRDEILSIYYHKNIRAYLNLKKFALNELNHVTRGKIHVKGKRAKRNFTRITHW